MNPKGARRHNTPSKIQNKNNKARRGWGQVGHFQSIYQSHFSLSLVLQCIRVVAGGHVR